jgi:predicted nucleic acid-binding protein
MDFVVLDTNVVISALRSRRGASFAIIRRIGQAWAPLISVPLILEYEAVGKRQAKLLKIPEETVEAIIRAFCFFGREIDISLQLAAIPPGPERRIPPGTRRSRPGGCDCHA